MKFGEVVKAAKLGTGQRICPWPSTRNQGQGWGRADPDFPWAQRIIDSWQVCGHLL